jgi:hypothetical protein
MKFTAANEMEKIEMEIIKANRTARYVLGSMAAAMVLVFVTMLL